MNVRRAALFLAVAILASGTVAYSADILGQVATNDVRMDGALVPAGSTLMSGSVLNTLDSPAIVHLENGRTVALDANTKATFGNAGQNRVRITVEQGKASYQGLSDQPVTVMAKNTLLLQEETIGEGAERMVELCTENADGSWTKTSYGASEVDARLAAGDVYPGKDNNNEGLGDDCEKDKNWFAALPPAGKGAVIVGGAGGAIVLADEIDDEASP